MPTLKDYAIHAFYKGSDYFKETVVGVGDIYYRTDAGVENTAWVVNLLLEQEDGHPCTSGIGFYTANTSAKDTADKLYAYSGKKVFEFVITPEIQLVLDCYRIKAEES